MVLVCAELDDGAPTENTSMNTSTPSVILDLCTEHMQTHNYRDHGKSLQY